MKKKLLSFTEFKRQVKGHYLYNAEVHMDSIKEMYQDDWTPIGTANQLRVNQRKIDYDNGRIFTNDSDPR